MLNVSIIFKGKDLLSLNTSKVERYGVDAAMETIGSRLLHVSITMCAYNYCNVCVCTYFQNAHLPITFLLEATPTEKIFTE